MTEPHKVVGRNIVRLRMKAGMTQEALAERAEISHRYLQSLEAGSKEPGLGVVVRIRSALGCEWEDLLRGL